MLRKKSLILLGLSIFASHSQAQTTPPDTWQEHWFEHEQLVHRVYNDNDVAVYHDDDVNPANTWMNSFAGDIWRYAKSVYGDFGEENRLYAIFHTGKYYGGHPSTYWEGDHDYRNVIDIGTDTNWNCKCGWHIETISHEISHIVEAASKGVFESPAFNIWGDSKWAEIFNYDVFLHLGMTAEAAEIYQKYMAGSEDFPRPGTYWFRDWFYPIYNYYGSYGGATVLNRFFELLAQHFPKVGNTYSRRMNMGEFVHFWSEAAGTDLKGLATNAFGWTDEYEAQYAAAKADFSFEVGVSVYEHCNYGGAAVALGPGVYTLNDLEALGITNNSISSLRISAGYKVIAFNDINFSGDSLALGVDNHCLVDEGFNDLITSLVVYRSTASGIVR